MLRGASIMHFAVLHAAVLTCWTCELSVAQQQQSHPATIHVLGILGIVEVWLLLL
jgi:hypothetical protein